MSGLIRKIVVGKDPKNAMAYFIGMRVGENKVSDIVHDEKHLYHHGINRYEIYVEQQDKSNILWKVVEEVPCTIEFDLNF